MKEITQLSQGYKLYMNDMGHPMLVKDGMRSKVKPSNFYAKDWVNEIKHINVQEGKEAEAVKEALKLWGGKRR